VYWLGSLQHAMLLPLCPLNSGGGGGCHDACDTSRMALRAAALRAARYWQRASPAWRATRQRQRASREEKIQRARAHDAHAHAPYSRAGAAARRLQFSDLHVVNMEDHDCFSTLPLLYLLSTSRRRYLATVIWRISLVVPFFCLPTNCARRAPVPLRLYLPRLYMPVYQGGKAGQKADGVEMLTACLPASLLLAFTTATSTLHAALL